MVNSERTALRSKLVIALTSCWIVVLSTPLLAQPEDFEGAVAAEKPTVLFSFSQPTRQPIPIPKKFKIVSLDDLQFTGPKPSDPFVLGNFACDGKWGLVHGYLQPLDGKNAAVQLAWADQFELEGFAQLAGQGGWFILVGWDAGRGFAVHNVTLKESGSPWFVSEFRGGRAIEGRTVELDKFDWKDERPFKLSVANSQLSLEVGKFGVIKPMSLSGYTPGRIIVGVYDTRYGPRPLRIRSLKIRALPPAETPPMEPAEKEPASSP